MTRIEYFKAELAKELGCEFDMALLAEMTTAEAEDVFLVNDVTEIPQIIADYYAMMS